MKPENVKCPDCDGEMVSRKSQYGTFWGCKDYPKCKGTRDSSGMSKAERDRLRQAVDEAADDSDDLPSTKFYRKR